MDFMRLREMTWQSIQHNPFPTEIKINKYDFSFFLNLMFCLVMSGCKSMDSQSTLVSASSGAFSSGFTLVEIIVGFHSFPLLDYELGNIRNTRHLAY
jgi:hypothetical protein